MKPKQVEQAGPLKSKGPKSKGKRGRPTFDDAEALRSRAFYDAIAIVFGLDPKDDQSNNAAAVSAINAAIAVGEYIGNSSASAVDRVRRKLRNRDMNALKLASDPQGARSIVRVCRLPFIRSALATRFGCGQEASDDALAEAVAEWARSKLN